MKTEVHEVAEFPGTNQDTSVALAPFKACSDERTNMEMVVGHNPEVQWKVKMGRKHSPLGGLFGRENKFSAFSKDGTPPNHITNNHYPFMFSRDIKTTA